MKILFNRSILIGWMLSALFLLTSCEGLFEGIYDEPTPPGQPDAAAEGFRPYTGPGVSTHRYTLKLDATAYDEWIYVDLHRLALERKPIPTTLTGEWDGRSGLTYNEVKGTQYTPYKTIQTDAQKDADQWDFAVHHFDIRTNKGAAAETEMTSIDGLLAGGLDLKQLKFSEDIWSTTQAIVDLREMMGFRVGYQNTFVNPPLTRWVTMDFSNPPPVYSTSDKACILRLSDGTYAALHLLSYMNEVGVKGYLTIDVIYPY